MTIKQGEAMKIKVLLAPGIETWSEKDIGRSPVFTQLVRERRIKFVCQHWDGAMNTVPLSERVIIVITLGLIEAMGDNWTIFAGWCGSVGHLLFLMSDITVAPDGQVVHEGSPERIRNFFDALVPPIVH